MKRSSLLQVYGAGALTLCSALLLGCSPDLATESDLVEDTSSPAIYAAYVLLAPPGGVSGKPQPVARVILDGSDPSAGCPSLQTSSGAPPPALQQRTAPANFSDVMVCEAAVPFGQGLTVASGGTVFSLPAAKSDPQHLILMGDTGCKDNHSQDCNDASQWPFQGLSQQAAKASADLFLHVGDFNYRGTPGGNFYDAQGLGDPQCELQTTYVSQNASGSTQPDSWAAWRDDFFAPAADLLAATPMVAARGNHELCSRAGPGWFYFLDPDGPALGTPQRSCPSQDGAPTEPIDPSDPSKTHITTRPAYTLELDTLRLLVVDSANACDEHAPAATTSVYTTELTKELSNLPASPPTWLLSHRPAYGVFDPSKANPQQPTNYESQGLLTALGAAWGSNGPPTGLDLIVAGHMHRFQSFSQSTDPSQLVVGNGGVHMFKPSGSQSWNTKGGDGLDIYRFGFMDLMLSGASWTSELKDSSGNTFACCSDSTERLCSLATSCGVS